LAALEGRLGVALLQRGSRFALTDVGRDYLECVATVVDAGEALVAELSSEVVRARGTLRVAASSLFAEEFLVPVMATYLREHAEVSLELHLAIDRVDLRAHHIDVAFRSGPLVDADDFTSLRLGQSINGFFASPAYVRERGKPTSAAELTRHALVVVGEPGRPQHWRIEEGGHEKRLELRPRVLAPSFRLALDACVHGLGITRMPTFVANEWVATGALVPVLRSAWHRSDVHAVFPRGLAAGLKTRSFVEAAKRALTASRLAPRAR
jgi:DNA-binding transcriptional LysR family regulator